MEDWRSKALTNFPELEYEISRNQSGPLGLWTDLHSALAGAYQATPINDDLIGRIYDFAAWCFRQPETGDAETDLSNPTAVAFIESLPLVWQGKLIRESTKQGNDKVARQMEAAHRTSLAKGEVGIRERKPSPTLVEFMSHTFQPWVEATFREKPRTKVWYRGGIRRLSELPLLAKARLSEITAEMVHAYIVKRQTDGLNVTSINRELQILRRILRLSVEWGTVQSTVKVRLLPGEKRRERVLGVDEESRYLAAAHEPLASIASLLVDSGLRPDEALDALGIYHMGQWKAWNLFSHVW